MSDFSDQELLRYSRQILLPEVGIEGQDKLDAAHVVLFGVGGLGSLTAAYLVASGIGQITIVDDDVVDLSNLHRQLLYAERDVGSAKVDVARQKLTQMNPECQIVSINQRQDKQAMIELVQDADLVLDGTDNFASRFQINEACFQAKTPLLSAAVTRFSAQLSLYDYADASVCYACLFSQDDIDDAAEQACSENGVLGPAVGIAASWQALDAIKYLVGLSVESLHHLVLIDMLSGMKRCVALQRDNNCPVCGIAPTAKNSKNNK